jgi:hypothetical protein
VCGALIQLDLSLGCTLLDILGASYDRAQRVPIDSPAPLLKIVNRVADPRRDLSISFRCGVADVRCGVRQLASKVPDSCVYLGGEEHAGGGSDQCATEETNQKAAAMAAGGLESWLGSVFMSCFSHLISMRFLSEFISRRHNEWLRRKPVEAIGGATPNS